MWKHDELTGREMAMASWHVAIRCLEHELGHQAIGAEDDVWRQYLQPEFRQRLADAIRTVSSIFPFPDLSSSFGLIQERVPSFEQLDALFGRAQSDLRRRAFPLFMNWEEVQLFQARRFKIIASLTRVRLELKAEMLLQTQRGLEIEKGIMVSQVETRLDFVSRALEKSLKRYSKAA